MTGPLQKTQRNERLFRRLKGFRKEFFSRLRNSMFSSSASLTSPYHRKPSDSVNTP